MHTELGATPPAASPKLNPLNIWNHKKGALKKTRRGLGKISSCELFVVGAVEATLAASELLAAAWTHPAHLFDSEAPFPVSETPHLERWECLTRFKQHLD